MGNLKDPFWLKAGAAQTTGGAGSLSVWRGKSAPQFSAATATDDSVIFSPSPTGSGAVCEPDRLLHHSFPRQTLHTRARPNTGRVRGCSRVSARRSGDGGLTRLPGRRADLRLFSGSLGGSHRPSGERLSQPTPSAPGTSRPTGCSVPNPSHMIGSTPHTEQPVRPMEVGTYRVPE
jgi:hypothetical protein